MTSKQQKSSQLLKAYIRIAETHLSTLINIEVSVYIILKDFTKKFKLKIKANDRIKVALLKGKSKVKVIGLIPNAPITVQNPCTLELLYVIKGTESVVIFGINWIDYYQADIRRSDNIMKVRINNKKVKIGLQY